MYWPCEFCDNIINAEFSNKYLKLKFHNFLLIQLSGDKLLLVHSRIKLMSLSENTSEFTMKNIISFKLSFC